MSKPVCVVIGIGPGNGRAFAERFAQEGYAVALLSRTTDYASSIAAQLDDARAYVRRHRAGFDVIYSLSSNTFAALASGSFAMAESYLELARRHARRCNRWARKCNWGNERACWKLDTRC